MVERKAEGINIVGAMLLMLLHGIVAIVVARLIGLSRNVPTNWVFMI